MSALMSGKNRLPILWLLGAVVLAAGDVVPSLQTARPPGDLDTYYVVAHPAFTIGLPAAFCLFAAIYFALARTPAVRVREILGYAHFAIMLLGAALIRAPATALILAGPPARFQDLAAALGFWSQLAAIGYSLSLAALLLFAYVVFDGWRRTRGGATGG